MAASVERRAGTSARSTIALPIRIGAATASGEKRDGLRHRHASQPAVLLRRGDQPDDHDPKCRGKLARRKSSATASPAGASAISRRNSTPVVAGEASDHVKRGAQRRDRVGPARAASSAGSQTSPRRATAAAAGRTLLGPEVVVEHPEVDAARSATLRTDSAGGPGLRIELAPRGQQQRIDVAGGTRHARLLYDRLITQSSSNAGPERGPPSRRAPSERTDC